MFSGGIDYFFQADGGGAPAAGGGISVDQVQDQGILGQEAAHPGFELSRPFAVNDFYLNKAIGLTGCQIILQERFDFPGRESVEIEHIGNGKDHRFRERIRKRVFLVIVLVRSNLFGASRRC
jgi:hypothetical protein